MLLCRTYRAACDKIFLSLLLTYGIENDKIFVQLKRWTLLMIVIRLANGLLVSTAVLPLVDRFGAIITYCFPVSDGNNLKKALHLVTGN